MYSGGVWCGIWCYSEWWCVVYSGGVWCIVCGGGDGNQPVSTMTVVTVRV